MKRDNRKHRALRKAGKVLGWLVAVPPALLLILLVFTPLLLNTTTLSFAAKKFGSAYRPEWSRLELKVGWGLLTKRVRLDAEKLCVDEKAGSMSGCFTKLSLDATVKLGARPLVSVRRLETLVVHAEPLRLDATKAAPAEEKEVEDAEPARMPGLVPAPMSRMTVGVIDVRVPEAVLKSTSGTTTASVTAGFDSKKSGPLKAEAFAVVKGTTSAPPQEYRAALTLDSDLFRDGKLTRLDAALKASGSKGLKAEVTAKVEQPAKDELKLTARAEAAASGKSLAARLSGTQTPERYTLQADLSALDPAGTIRRAELKGCELTANLKKKTTTVEDAELSCGLALQPAPFGRKPGAKPSLLTGTLSGGAKFSSALGRDKFESDLRLALGPSKDHGGFTASLDAKLAGLTADFPKGVTDRHSFEAGARVPSFEALVAFLDGTEYAIPAPLNALRGPITLEARTTGDTSGRSQDVSFELTTDLSSARQAVDVVVKGKAKARDLFLPSQTVATSTDVNLRKVVVEMPFLKIGAVPAPVVDTRIKTGSAKRDASVEAERRSVKKRPKKAQGDFDARVRTTAPIIIRSNLLKNPMPISLDVRARPAGLSGEIKVEPFDVEVFRQVGHVDHITFKPVPGAEGMPLDGKIVYKKNDATVDILILGSTAKPAITFRSDPPMTPNEVAGLLLYGKSPAELDADQQASAGNAAAAMTSGALGLMSLYLFAATPIDSVGYDAATQTYQIRFKLPGGATLAVGSDLQESQSLTLRKRVARSVELVTQMNKEQTQQKNALTTFLQWFKRY
jgi:hypothetical protein